MLVPLSYFENTAALFDFVADAPWSVFLDSGHQQNETSGRYDIIAIDPVASIVTQGEKTTINHYLSGNKNSATSDPFDLLRDLLDQYREQIPHHVRQNIKLPFIGGAMGYFSYDLGRRIEKLPSTALDAEDLPEMALGIYDCVLIVDHHKKQSFLSTPSEKNLAQKRITQWQTLLQKARQQNKNTNHNKYLHDHFKVTGDITSNLSFKRYARAFDTIQAYIRAGDCYQVNLTQRFSAPATGRLWHTYHTLKAINPAPFSAYFNTPFGEILSASPERFLSVQCEDERDTKQNRHRYKVSTKPIKGTRPRADDPVQDQALANALKNSSKDRAENVMIVDLLRNDLGRVCKTGTVNVPKLFAIESYATVHHLVSTVEGILDNNQDAISLLRAAFPGGSITGAPKIRAMEIIEEVEPNRRGIYCGALGYIDFNGNMDTNIMIRSLIYNQNEVRFWVGGGIVYDSNVDEEYQETLDKGAALLELLKLYKVDINPTLKHV